MNGMPKVGYWVTRSSGSRRDDQLNGAVALRRAKELVEEEKCDFIGGTLSGAISLAINEFACKNKIPYVAYCQSDMVLGNRSVQVRRSFHGDTLFCCSGGLQVCL